MTVHAARIRIQVEFIEMPGLELTLPPCAGTATASSSMITARCRRTSTIVHLGRWKAAQQWRR